MQLNEGAYYTCEGSKSGDLELMVLRQITKSLHYVGQSVSKHLAGSYWALDALKQDPLVFSLRSNDRSAVVDTSPQLAGQSLPDLCLAMPRSPPRGALCLRP